MPRHPRKSRKRPVSNGLDFARLENRQLLAANLGGGLQVPNALPVDTNLVANGDFETFDQGTSPQFTNTFATGRFLPESQVAGWNVSDGDGDGGAQINLLSFSNDRGTILDLDSLAGQDDRVFQDITTEARQRYMLAFDFRNSPLAAGDTDNLTNEFEVYWNGNLLASMSGGTFWQTASYVVVGASDTPGDDTPGQLVTSRLEFRDMRDGNRGGDGRGSLIDCVRLSAVTETAITNGGWENIGAGPGPNFSPDEVEGWSVFSFPDDASERVIQVNQFQADETSIGGTNYLSVNSDSSRVDQVFQDLATSAGRTYYVTFDYRQDPSSTADADQLRVRWNDQWAATFSGSSEWQSVGILLDAESDSTRLTLREPGDETGDGAGAQIDNVRLFQIDQVVNDLIVDLNGTLVGETVSRTFVEGSTPVVVAPSLQVSHPSGDQISSAEVTLLGPADNLTESLAVDAALVADAGLGFNYDASSGVLSITGDATIAQYQALLRTLTYQNTAQAFTAATRDIGFTVTDNAITLGGERSDQVTGTVTLTNQNDAPTIAAIPDVSTAFGSQVSLTAAGSDLDGDALTYAVSVAGLSAQSSQPTISETGEFEWVPTEAGEFEVTVTATDAANAQTTRTFDVEVSEFVPFQGTGALSNVPGLQKQAIYSSPPPQNIDTSSTYDAVINTDVGEIQIRLLDDESPTFVNNFVNLARDGFYDGLVFHRVIDGFVAQGGDPQGTSTSTVPGEGAGQGGPGYQIPDEDNSVQFDSRGQLSYANSGPNTTGSQFFITFGPTGLANTPTPNGRGGIDNFAVFGNVTAGDDILNQIVRTQLSNNAPISDAVPTIINSITIVETPDSST